MIALFAGSGALPGVLIDRLRRSGDAPLVCEMAGHRADVPADVTPLRFRIETLATVLGDLRDRGVTRICLAGAVRRPEIDPAAIDAATEPMMAQLRDAMGLGDDGTLRALMSLIEAAGFAIVAAQDIAPDLLPPAGVPTRAAPGPDASRDAALGEATVAAMGRADAGQACVVRDRIVVAREGADGTDALLAGLTPDHPGGLLFKAPKPGQDRRADLPVIGPATAIAVAGAGLSGLVIQAGGVMVIDLPKVVEILDVAGRFLWVRDLGHPA